MCLYIALIRAFKDSSPKLLSFVAACIRYVTGCRMGLIHQLRAARGVSACSAPRAAA